MLLTIKEAAEYLSVHRETVLNEVHAGRLIGFKVASVWRFDKRDLDAYIDNQRRDAAQRAQAAAAAKKPKLIKMKTGLPGLPAQVIVDPIWLPGNKIQDAVARNAAAAAKKRAE